MTTIGETRPYDFQPRSRLLGLFLVAASALAVAAAGGLLASEQPLLAVVAILALPLTVAILTWPDVATLATIFILYSNIAAVAVRFHDVPYLVGAAFPLLLVIPLTAHLVLRRQKLVFTPALPFILLFLFIQFLGTLFARDINGAFAELTVFIIEGLGIYFLITNVVRTPEMLRRVVWVLLLAGVALAVVPIYQQLTGDFDNIYGGFGQISEVGFRTGEETLLGEVRQPRLAGAIGEQNRFAQILLMLVPLGLFRFWGERSLLLRLLALLVTAVIGVGVILTFSRGVAVGFLLLLVIIAFMRLIKPYQIIAVLLVAFLLLALLPQYGTRLASLQSLLALFSDEDSLEDGSIEGRTTEMLAAALVFADHPLIGVGPGMFKYYSTEYGNRINPGILEGTREAHSLYLGVAADNGFLGLVSFLAIVTVTLFNLLRARRQLARSRPELANLAGTFALAIVAYLTTGLFLHLSYARYFWLMMALAGAAGAIARAAQESELVQLTAGSQEDWSPEVVPVVLPVEEGR
ncbi:MAG: O-antigen ligase family protein [Chloroflexi bacterium]|nr:O-antigen ligase family protein [Chloroflexota bacterium]MCI0575258.1 O-antigen ligase family protein [Chloroflexota bacterium]MCI0645704.1 O-antigen ligase family protein [Chloroflexota bacterium]MCI0731235.1 O-antigen ligase family protein [Chloroflexota bacterium]